MKINDVMALYWRGYGDALGGKATPLKDLEEMVAETRPVEPAENEDRCFCEDCLNESGDTSDAEMDEKFGFHIEYVADDDPVITVFVVCVNDQPYPDTFSEDASMTWQPVFLPILEADPSLGNEDVRLVKLVEE